MVSGGIDTRLLFFAEIDYGTGDGVKKIQFLALTLATSFAARADFSYTQTTTAPVGTQATRVAMKGSRMMTDSFTTTNIIDFKAQTITIINKPAKSYTVQKLAEMIESKGKVTPQIEIKETGLKRTINGYNCNQILMTMTADTAPTAGPAGKVQVEMEIWISADVPGWQSMHAFYQENGSSLVAMAARNSGVPRAMAEMQLKVANANGIPVLQVVRMKAPKKDTMSAQEKAKDDQDRARLEDMARQPGAEGQMAQRALAKLRAVHAAGSTFETTTESSNFSTEGIPASAFEVPAGFVKK
jgi:hypothetical protein